MQDAPDGLDARKHDYYICQLVVQSKEVMTSDVK